MKSVPFAFLLLPLNFQFTEPWILSSDPHSYAATHCKPDQVVDVEARWSFPLNSLSSFIFTTCRKSPLYSNCCHILSLQIISSLSFQISGSISLFISQPPPLDLGFFVNDSFSFLSLSVLLSFVLLLFFSSLTCRYVCPSYFLLSLKIYFFSPNFSLARFSLFQLSANLFHH